MRNTAMLLLGTVGFGFVNISTAFLAQPAVTDHDQKVVEAITPVWENERDILVMLGSAEDRIGLAHAVVNVSLSAAGLSDRQRYDGLRVAGSSLFHDKRFADAAAALARAADYTAASREKAEVTAASAEAMALMGPGHAAEALAAFVVAADTYLSCDPEDLRPAAVGAAFRRVVNMALEQDEHSKALTYANHAVAMAEQAVLGVPDLGYFRYSAAFAADLSGDHTQAVHLYDKFIAAHPGYLNAQPILGIMVHAGVRRQLADGSSWESPDEALITKMMEILRNPDFTLMPARTNYIEKLAASWDKQHATEAAAALRSELAKLTYPALAELDPNDAGEAMLGRQLWRELAVSQLNGAHSLYRVRNNPDDALVFLGRVTGSSAFASDDLVQEALRFKQEITGAP